MASRSESVVRSFIGRINAHDPEGIVALCGARHIFIDSLGRRISGRAKLLTAWRGYFGLVEDYRVHASVLLSRGPLVVVLGSASGSIASASSAGGSAWSIPAAWRALVKGGRVALWQVFADNTPVTELLRRARS